MGIGRLTKVAVRELWPDEAQDFTTWLSENIDILAEALNLKMALVDREVNVGPFAADLLAEDDSGNLIIIENQFGKTDHDHLGKLLTYLVNLGAKTAVWITEEPRPEHIKVASWLNEVTPDDISVYLVKLEAYQIGNSPPAPLFSVIAAPSGDVKRGSQVKDELAVRHRLRLEFWEQLLTKAKEKTRLHANISPSKENWISAGAGRTGLVFIYRIFMDKAAVEFYIDKGVAEENKKAFDILYAKKDEIEGAFGGPLIWQRMDDRRGCRICAWVSEGRGLENREAWSEIQDAMIDAMIRLSNALKKEIQML